jgi:hypothetical protein
MHYFFDININDINVTLRVVIGDSKVKIRIRNEQPLLHFGSEELQETFSEQSIVNSCNYPHIITVQWRTFFEERQSMDPFC